MSASGTVVSAHHHTPPQSPRNGWATMLSRTQTIFTSNRQRMFNAKHQQPLNRPFGQHRPRRASDPSNSNLFLPFDGDNKTDDAHNPVTLLKSPITITSPRFDSGDESDDNPVPINSNKPAKEFFIKVRQQLQRQVSQKLPRRKRGVPRKPSNSSLSPQKSATSTTPDMPPLANSLIIAAVPSSRSTASSILHTPVNAPGVDTSNSTFSPRTFSSSDQSIGCNDSINNNSPNQNFGLGIDMRLFNGEHQLSINDSTIAFHDSDCEDTFEIIPPSVSSPGAKATSTTTEKVWCPLTPPPTSPMPNSVYSSTAGFSTPNSIMFEDHYDATSRSSFSSLTHDKPLSCHHSKTCLPHTRCSCFPGFTDTSQMQAQMKIDDDAYAAAERRLRKSGWCSKNDIEEVRRKRKVVRQEWKTRIKTAHNQQKRQDGKHN